ncbi:hypothetical protein [Terasakiella sp. SH-1]|uniref:hypothetical protein n=1 Tax=Terasakiella sp. SH-1 TaxID=2560057 RepID=UPI0010741EC4|nr:hypothetical protein [Terasakiella sp. SH-1]
MKKFVLYLVAITFSFPAFGKGETLEGCIAAHDRCIQDCRNLESTPAKATCIAQCAGGEAQCVGRVGIGESKPYIRKKADQLEKLLDDFFGDILPLPKEEIPKDSPTDT